MPIKTVRLLRIGVNAQSNKLRSHIVHIILPVSIILGYDSKANTAHSKANVVVLQRKNRPCDKTW